MNWQNKSIKILGFQIGNVNPRTIWHDSLEGLKKQKLLINVPCQTWQAKSLLAKSKVLPQIIYNAHTYPLDTTSRKLIETELLNYLTNNPTISLSMRSLQIPMNDGGIKFPNSTTYCDLIYIYNLFQYFKIREKNNPFNTETYLIEFEIGMSLSKLYDLPILNHIPHRDYPTPYYQSLEPGKCALCLQFQDTAVYVFAKCSITRQIWTILQEVLNNITEISFPLDSFTPLNFYVPIKFESSQNQLPSS